MIYKPRSIPIELLILTFLNVRMILPEKYLQRYYRLKKGYEGEVMFDQLTEKLESDCLILNGLLLMVHNYTFQVDSLIIFADKIYLFEIKNFEGDYYLETDRLYKRPKIEYSNPLTQLSKCESHFRQLLQELNYHSSIDASVVFMNPEFTLYQMPLDKPIISPNQVNRLMRQLNKISSKLKEKHKELADKLILLDLKEYPDKDLPPYEYGHLRKGIVCSKCNSFSMSITGKYCVCGDCGNKETVTVAVLRSVDEFKLLFPNEKITTNVILDWCQIVKSPITMRKILGNHFNKVGVHQWTYFE